MTAQTMTLGYARMGKRRELKKALEGFWSGALGSEALLATFWDLETQAWQTQLQAGIDHIAVGDQTLYDHVLDWATWLGLIPSRFRGLSGLDRYFAMARGREGLPALEMTKWFDTNYHYLVPEIEPEADPSPNFGDFLERVRRAQGILGERTSPVVLSPVTLLCLSQRSGDLRADLEKLLPLYRDLLQELKQLGIPEVQIHDPILVTSQGSGLREAVEMSYRQLATAGIPVHLVTYFDDLGETYPWVVQLPVAGISLDFTRGHTLDLVRTYGFPADQILGAGVVDARNVWKVQPETVLASLRELQGVAPNLRVQPSASLQFVPHDAALEAQLPEPLRNVLSFAEQKLAEVALLARALNGEDPAAQHSEKQQQ
ncbi:5-methyltetrahydropteroyltriglutamate--homocysteine S-methyltransferase, partial [Synechococcus sp. R55.2]